ncbi:hypothetical protein KKC1_15300 [Calderihabitans maritimus]|uniref:Uncharacterized protein n=1 Tax=Calderihabitans maritimus TaxID=1246530 RepID=A0A1Z5HST5_9FIRM|nr:hypothetical protein KKC1_15300 [Calderihabitans maritimus]
MILILTPGILGLATFPYRTLPLNHQPEIIYKRVMYYLFVFENICSDIHGIFTILRSF